MSRRRNRIWRHDERASAAWRAEIEEEKRRGAAIISFGLSSGSDKPAETETVLRASRCRNTPPATNLTNTS